MFSITNMGLVFNINILYMGLFFSWPFHKNEIVFGVCLIALPLVAILNVVRAFRYGINPFGPPPPLEFKEKDHDDN